MKLRLFTSVCLSALSLQAYQSLHLPANAALNLTIPAVSPFTAFGDNRFVARIHDWTLPVSGSVHLVSTPSFFVYLDSSGNLCWNNAGADVENSFGATVCVSVFGLSDVVFRAQRFGATYPVHDPSPGSSFFEVMDLSTGTVLPYSCVSWQNTGCPIDTANPTAMNGTAQALGATVGYSVAWLKWWSTTVAPGSPFESESMPADLADFRFEGNLTNAGTGGYAVTLAVASGSPTYATSPIHSPVCQLRRQIFRNGAANQLVQYGFALDTTGALSYNWSLTAGQTGSVLTGAGTASPTISKTVFGPGTFQLQLTDGSSNVTTCSIKDGFVNASANGIVQTGSAAADAILGPLIMLGMNPWGWYDDRHVAEANMQMANLPTYFYTTSQPWNTAGPGTITMATGTFNVVGTGTNFTAPGGTAATGAACPGGVIPSQGSYILIWWPNANVPGGTGRRIYQVTSCTDATHLTGANNNAWNDQGALPPTTCQVGHACQYTILDGAVWGNYAFNASPADFYDCVLAFYALWYRSGIDDYLNAARALADAQWQLRLDSGYNYFYGESFNTFPRNESMAGLVLRALDGRSDMWGGIEQMALFRYDQLVQWFNAFGNWDQIQGDPREEGYILAQLSYCALFDPTSANANTCRSYVDYMMTHMWTPSRFPDGNFYSLYWASTGRGSSWETGTSASLTNGSSAVTCVNGTGTCNWTSDMFTVNINGVNYPQVWWFTNSTTAAPRGTPFGNSEGDAVAYYPVMVDSSHATLKDINGNTVNYAGTTGSHGWAEGTISQQVGFGVQPFMYGILGMAFDFAAKALACYGVNTPANCDAAQSANGHAFSVQVANYLRTTGYWPTTKGMYYSAGFINCQPPVSDANEGCTNGNDAPAARQLNAEALRAVMAAYLYNHDPLLGAFANTLYTAMWGKPGWSLPAGQVSDGKYIWAYNDGFGFNMFGTPPAGQEMKYFGMGFGIGAGAGWPADLIYPVQGGPVVVKH